jgi:hypothetical protein
MFSFMVYLTGGRKTRVKCNNHVLACFLLWFIYLVDGESRVKSNYLVQASYRILFIYLGDVVTRV